MTTESLAPASVATKANVYFDGKCVSHTLHFADGSRKTIGVILPATLSFTTEAPEIMECVGGCCEYRLAGSEAWTHSSVGEKFSVPADTAFEIRTAEGYHYICHFG
jgi:uncharacterized protein YaiE (UPF0345 family)